MREPPSLKWQKVEEHRARFLPSDRVKKASSEPSELYNAQDCEVITLGRPWKPETLTQFDEYAKIGDEYFQPIEYDRSSADKKGELFMKSTELLAQLGYVRWKKKKLAKLTQEELSRVAVACTSATEPPEELRDTFESFVGAYPFTTTYLTVMKLK